MKTPLAKTVLQVIVGGMIVLQLASGLVMLRSRNSKNPLNKVDLYD